MAAGAAAMQGELNVPADVLTPGVAHNSRGVLLKPLYGPIVYKGQIKTVLLGYNNTGNARQVPFGKWSRPPTPVGDAPDSTEQAWNIFQWYITPAKIVSPQEAYNAQGVRLYRVPAQQPNYFGWSYIPSREVTFLGIDVDGWKLIMFFVSSYFAAVSVAASSAQLAAGTAVAGPGLSAAQQGALTYVSGQYAQATGDSTLSVVAKVSGVFSGNIAVQSTPDIAAGFDAGTLGSGNMDLDAFDVSFDVGNSNPFDGFNFSDGEATSWWSDASLNGFPGVENGDIPSVLDPIETNGWGFNDYDFSGSGDLDLNATPEVSTNDFGTSFDEDWGEGDEVNVSPTQIATGASSVIKATQGTGATSGANGAKKQGGSNDILSTIMSTVGKISQTAQQVTTAVNRNSTGQLAPAGGLAPAASNSNMILIAGVGLLAVAIFLHAKG